MSRMTRIAHSIVKDRETPGSGFEREIKNETGRVWRMEKDNSRFPSDHESRGSFGHYEL